MSTLTSHKPSLWTKTTTKVKKAVEIVASGDPIARLTSTVEAQTLWPASLEKESHQAALMLRGFFLDGFVVPYRMLGQCPPQGLQGCKGIAIFHILRPELQCPSGVGGSGVVLAKKADGEWSCPSGITLRTEEARGLEFPDGADCLDIVCIINDFSGMKGFSDPSCTLGRDITVTAGPMPATFEEPDRREDVWVYVKGKGHLAADVSLDGLVVEEDAGANASLYGEEGISAKVVLGGLVQAPGGSEGDLVRTLEVIAGQETDCAGVPQGKSPGDCSVKNMGGAV